MATMRSYRLLRVRARMASTSSRSALMGAYRSGPARAASADVVSSRLMARPSLVRRACGPPRETSELSVNLESYIPGGEASTGRRLRRSTPRRKRLGVAPEGAAAAPALLLQPHALDGHNTIDRLAHVVNGQGGDADGGQGLHLDAGAAEDAYRRL